MVALVPSPGGVGRDPYRDAGVVAAAQAGQQTRVQAGPAACAGGVHRTDRLPQRFGDLTGPGLAGWVDRVDVVQVPQRVRQALLDAGQVVVVAEVAAVVVADQDPTEGVQDPEPADGRLGPVPGRAVPDQIPARPLTAG